MKLGTVYIRYYRSFNYDYLRKHHPEAEPSVWESEEPWYPYVRIAIDPNVTAVVGANESGKSHLLDAIERGLTGQGLKREDFCRYSHYFTVERGKLRWPDFGFEWHTLSESEQSAVREACQLEGDGRLERFMLFRTDTTKLTVYLPSDSGFVAAPVVRPEALEEVLPPVFRIDPKLALPDSVSLSVLAEPSLAPATVTKVEQIGRQRRFDLLESVLGNTQWYQTAETITQNANAIYKTIFPSLAAAPHEDNGTARDRGPIGLAHDLLHKIARVDPEAFKELHRALREERDAYANSLIQEINDSLARELNFPHWWIQDRDFQLLVSPREFDLVFTIRDRTGTEYSFSERSSGLKYFLSYYIQYLAHKPQDGRTEVLLMDEPDAFLSSQGQQDLLKIFESFAAPDNGRPPVQVIYVTHSPFLIDKNHGERIRVLEKGVGDEGTRVVRDASKNHYEPLRSSFGVLVGETVFIGNCNLMVEGLTDQIFLVGASNQLRRSGAASVETLDLNHLTVVPAGSASHIPYLVYLARGRDIEQPAIIVLLDSDQAGNDARAGIRKAGPKGKPVLKEEFVLQVGDLGKGRGALKLPSGAALLEIEDLVPCAIYARAVKKYLEEISGAPPVRVSKVESALLSQERPADVSTFDFAKGAVHAEFGDNYHVEKVGLARLVIEIVRIMESGEEQPGLDQAQLDQFSSNMRILIGRLDNLRRQAERELSVERVSARVGRAVKTFRQTYATSARREDGKVLLEEIEAVLDNTPESDPIRLAIQTLRRDFGLDRDFTRPIEEHSSFLERLDGLRYEGRRATQEPDPIQGDGVDTATV